MNEFILHMADRRFPRKYARMTYPELNVNDRNLVRHFGERARLLEISHIMSNVRPGPQKRQIFLDVKLPSRGCHQWFGMRNCVNGCQKYSKSFKHGRNLATGFTYQLYVVASGFPSAEQQNFTDSPIILDFDCGCVVIYNVSATHK